jgi:hypothetical protein
MIKTSTRYFYGKRYFKYQAYKRQMLNNHLNATLSHSYRYNLYSVYVHTAEHSFS